MKVELLTERELAEINALLENLDLNVDITFAMSYVRKIQGLSFGELSSRFINIDEIMWKRYMQPSYPSSRPMHVVAAYSWMTMLPMTYFFKGLNIRKTYSNLDEDATDAILCAGHIPVKQFNILLELIYNMLSDEGKSEVAALRAKFEAEHADFTYYLERDFFPPERLDIVQFSLDYYQSIAIKIKAFRLCNGLSKELMARVLGISAYKYDSLEDPGSNQSFALSVGMRFYLSFKWDRFISFSDHMKMYPEFNTMRTSQYFRENLLVESLKQLPQTKRKTFFVILKNLAELYI